MLSPTVQSVMSRVSDVTRTPQTNGEFAQLVYYHACAAEGDAPYGPIPK